MNKHESRRKLLKSIAAGSGAIVAGKSLPESWSKPVVDSVILPVHAQTSCATTPINGDITVTQGNNTLDIEFVFAIGSPTFTLTQISPNVYELNDPNNFPPECNSGSVVITANLVIVGNGRLVSGTFVSSIQCPTENCDNDLTFTASGGPTGPLTGTYTGTQTCCPV